MKVLCIDGGGIRGVFAISLLHALEEDYGHPIHELFDLVAGTSTGSIIATSVIVQHNMKDVLDSYKKYGKKIFVHQAKIGLFKSVYSDRFLRKFLQRAFGNTQLSDIYKPLLIPAVDLSHGKPYVHRSNYGHPESEHFRVQLWDAVLSSCSAPIYFPPNNIHNQYLSIDGGLWANNPSLVCVTEAIHHFKVPMSDIKIVSLGTGQQKIDFPMEKKKDWGIRNWLPFQIPSMKVTPKLLDLALHLSSESVSYHCQLLLGENYIRLNEQLHDEIPFDELDSIDELIELGRQAYRHNKKKLIRFLELDS
ncbi:CBASS cGAMP-activated phospholipase [Bacillus salitolerans]|uniref:CBASS cGAMP-activated phospholipase n=1 Tax=Bacillus salitolerans TaxID=1437434 RepID=A0ABW4LR64_9BACI